MRNRPPAADVQSVRRVRRAIGAIFAAGALAGTLCCAAQAAPPQLAVVVHQAVGPPTSYLSVQAQPGQQVGAGSLTIENLSDQAAVVQLDLVDALTTGTLGSAYEASGTPVHGATGWLSLSATSLPLAPHASGDVAVTVAVPVGAAPGDYLSGISILAADTTGAGTSTHRFATDQQDRYAVGVEMQVAGARHAHLGFSGASVEREPSSLVFQLLAHNDGNAILQGVTGTATITQGSRLVASQTIAPGTFVTGTDIAIPVRTPNEDPAPGTVYRVRAELDYPGGVTRLDTLVTFDAGAAHGPGSGSGATGTPTPRPPGGSSQGSSTVHPSTTGRLHRRHRAAHRPTAQTGTGTAQTTPSQRRGRGGPPHGQGHGAASLARQIAEAASTVAKHAAFPIILAVLMAVFFLVQDRIDRRDPKLALAPVHADPQLDFV